MVEIIIRTVRDEASGLVGAEVYADQQSDPVLRSEPAFASHEELIEEILTMCRTRFPDHMPFVEDPTIGV